MRGIVSESSETEGPGGEPAEKPALDLSASRLFPGWLAEEGLSVAFTTYQAGRLFLIGSKEDGRLSMFERHFPRCMGLWASSESLWLSSLYQLWRFENALEPGQTHKGFDRLYVPRVGYTTGDVDVHDIAVDADGRVIFVNTLFSCIATVSEIHSFEPLWHPPFISKLAPEDRCHLNGLAMVEGRPKVVSAVCQSDVADGWRDRRTDGGCLIDVENGAIITRGLSMPHSPRIYQGKLWVLESGTGYLGHIDLATGQFERVTFCPGFLRGLAFFEDFAIVGLSKPRDGRLSGLPLDENLKAHDAEPRCGFLVIDLSSGAIVHWFRIEGLIEELYDVAVLPGVVRPTALGFKTDEIRRFVTMPSGG